MQRSKRFDYIFIACGLLIQVVTFTLSLFHSFTLSFFQLSLLSFLSGCLGVCSVCLTAQKNIYMYAFGFAQIITYSILCWAERFYAGIAINAYYLVTLIGGFFIWRQNIKHNTSNITHNTSTVTTRRLNGRLWLVLLVATLALSWLVGWGLETWTDDTQPYLDAFTTVPALVAQILMILLFREHWFLWLAVDIVSVVLWLRAENYCMAAQYVFWCSNCIYGIYKWKK